MAVFRHSLVVLALSFLSACASTNPAPNVSGDASQTENKAEPSLIQSLPESIESFDYVNYRYFDDAGDGYQLRYSNQRKRRIASVFVYPVDEENKTLEHNQLVLGSTRATMQALGEAVKQGHYVNFNVVDAATKSQGIRTVARVQATYLQENLASYTLVYQTEHEGTFLKIRFTMPDNESNRSSNEWDQFADQIFKLIIDDLQSEDLQASST